MKIEHPPIPKSDADHLQQKFQSTVDWDNPLFIVGPSRSGTAMMRSMLMQNQAISMAGETHYFDDLRPRFENKSLGELSIEELNTCCDYFRSQTDRPYGKKGDPQKSWLTRKILLSTAKEIGDTTDSIFEAYCKLVAARDGAQIWGEKTPRHIFRVSEILEVFPHAKIICMVRDPRAVVASYRDWKHQGGLAKDDDVDYQSAIVEDEKRSQASYHIVIATMMWRAAVATAFKEQLKHGSNRVRPVKYEDLVNSPEATLRDICEWLDVEYSQIMLEIPLHNSSSAKYSEMAGVSKEPKNRWRSVLTEKEIGIVQKLSRKTLEVSGYNPVTVASNVWDVPVAVITLPVAIIKAVRANRSRFGSLRKYIQRRLLAVLGY